MAAGLTEGLAEAIALAEGLGVDPQKFLETIEGRRGAPYAKLKGPMMMEGRGSALVPARARAKDARLALEAARGGRGCGSARWRRVGRADGGAPATPATAAGHGGDDPRQPCLIALIIVDYQNDFAGPTARWSVPAGRGDRRGASTRWRPRVTRARGRDARLAPARPRLVRRAGRPWPPHCVAGHARERRCIPTSTRGPIDGIVDKGQDPGTEGYSGFEATGLAETAARPGVDEVTVVGLATDYCVKNTALDALREGFSGGASTAPASAASTSRPGDSERALDELAAAGATVA